MVAVLDRRLGLPAQVAQRLDLRAQAPKPLFRGIALLLELGDARLQLALPLLLGVHGLLDVLELGGQLAGGHAGLGQLGRGGAQPRLNSRLLGLEPHLVRRRFEGRGLLGLDARAHGRLLGLEARQPRRRLAEPRVGLGHLPRAPGLERVREPAGRPQACTTDALGQDRSAGRAGGAAAGRPVRRADGVRRRGHLGVGGVRGAGVEEPRRRRVEGRLARGGRGGAVAREEGVEPVGQIGLEPRGGLGLLVRARAAAGVAAGAAAGALRELALGRQQRRGVDVTDAPLGEGPGRFSGHRGGGRSVVRAGGGGSGELALLAHGVVEGARDGQHPARRERGGVLLDEGRKADARHRPAVHRLEGQVFRAQHRLGQVAHAVAELGAEGVVRQGVDALELGFVVD